MLVQVFVVYCKKKKNAVQCFMYLKVDFQFLLIIVHWLDQSWWPWYVFVVVYCLSNVVFVVVFWC